MPVCVKCLRELPNEEFDDVITIDFDPDGVNPNPPSDDTENMPVIGKLTMCFDCIEEGGRWVAKRMEESEGRRKQYRELREECIARLGGKCAVCGISDPRVLQIDHKDGKGAEDRAIHQRGRNSSIVYLRHILANLDRYQILCANHNWIKRVGNGEGLPRNKGKRGG